MPAGCVITKNKTISTNDKLINKVKSVPANDYKIYLSRSEDPKKNADAKLFSHLTYDDAFKLCSNGNTVVHPKTINHLKQKNIPLVIKNFDDLSKPGTVIS